MLDRIEFLVGEAFVALRRNGRMTFAAVSTCAVALFLIGGLGYAYLKISSFGESLTGRFEMRVFLKDGTEMDAISEAAQAIRALPNVKNVHWIPRDKAWDLMKVEMPDFTRGLDNPLPDAFKVTVIDIGKGRPVADAIGAMEVVQEKGVVYLDDEQRMIAQFLELLRWVGVGLGGLLFITAGVLIYNTIRLTIMARALEIRIMKLVGSTQATIQIPYAIEGMVQGLLGGILASVMMLGCHGALTNFLHSLTALGELPAYPLWPSMALMGAVGAAYGLLCSTLALRETMKSG